MVLALLLVMLAGTLSGQAPAVVDLRVEYLVNPVGLGEVQPRLSWRLEGTRRNVQQGAWQVLAAGSREALAAGKGEVWDSGRVNGRQSNQVVFGGRLRSRQMVYWKVRVWDEQGKASGWSAPGVFQMGLLGAGDWQGQWISYRDEAAVHTSRKELYLAAPRYYRKGWVAEKAVKRAVLYATALGIYDAYLNGGRVSEQMFAPGWSDYRKRVYYNAYDVTGKVKAGENVVGLVVSEGWYSGYVGYGLLVGYGPHKAGRAFYGKTPAVMAQLEVEYTDGTRRVVGTDKSWKVGTGGWTEADLLMGESFDARKEPEGWAGAGFDDGKWGMAIGAEENGSVKAPFFDKGGEREVELGFVRPAVVEAYAGPPVRPVEEVKAVGKKEVAPGVWVFDIGQNLAGVVKLKARGPAGTRIQLRFGEMVHGDGRIMTENLRKARATDVFVLKGTGREEVYTPRFTYHGFQYVEVTGYPGTPEMDAVTAVVVGSDTPLVGAFRAGNEMVNKLYRNIVWTQRANFVEIPTDCPQRDERLGWMGDAQAYARTAGLNADVASFFTKWLKEVDEAQRGNGAYADYAPYPMQHGEVSSYGTAWMDGGVLVPHAVWRMYGDKRVIERHWGAMTKFMDFRREASAELRGVKHGNPWGDWLSIGSATPLEYVDVTYFALVAKRMAEMAGATNQAHEESRYRGLHRSIRDRFQKDYVLADGGLKVETQTAYALALDADLIPANLRMAAGRKLAALVAKDGGRMTTGFLGTRPLIPMLSATGQNDLAVKLFLSKEFPSWGYEIENGATTVWERWNSYTKEKGFFAPAMNSFSHYAFGAVGQWMFETLAGIEAETAGYQRVAIRPHPPTVEAGVELPWVEAVYNSVMGVIKSRWERKGRGLEMEVTIPANVTGTVWVPARRVEEVKEADGAKFLRVEGDRVVYEVGSGTYRFRVE